MNNQTIDGNWDILKGKIKQQYADVTDDDLKHDEGQDEEFWGRVTRKVGQTKDEITKAIASL